MTTVVRFGINTSRCIGTNATLKIFHSMRGWDLNPNLLVKICLRIQWSQWHSKNSYHHSLYSHTMPFSYLVLRIEMPFFLVQVKYVSYSWVYRITKDPRAYTRPPDLLRLLQTAGVKVHGSWYSFGEYDTHHDRRSGQDQGHGDRAHRL